MPQYPNQDLSAMRQDAIRRSREMHRRAAASPPPPPAPPEIPDPPPPAETMPKPGIPAEGLHLPEELRSLLTDWDGERLALAALLYLLYKEGSDPALLLAMAYILL